MVLIGACSASPAPRQCRRTQQKTPRRMHPVCSKRTKLVSPYGEDYSGSMLTTQSIYAPASRNLCCDRLRPAMRNCSCRILAGGTQAGEIRGIARRSVHHRLFSRDRALRPRCDARGSPTGARPCRAGRMVSSDFRCLALRTPALPGGCGNAWRHCSRDLGDPRAGGERRQRHCEARCFATPVIS